MKEPEIDLGIFTDIYFYMSHLIFRGFESEVRELKLTKMEIFILLIVASNEGITMTELARQAGTSKVQMSRSIKQLEIANIVQRQTNQKNRRLVNVYSTTEGKILFKNKEQQIKLYVRGSLAVLTESDQEKLNEHFGEALTILKKYPSLLELD